MHKMKKNHSISEARGVDENYTGHSHLEHRLHRVKSDHSEYYIVHYNMYFLHIFYTVLAFSA